LQRAGGQFLMPPAQGEKQEHAQRAQAQDNQSEDRVDDQHDDQVEADQHAVERAWLAVNSRTSSSGSFIDVCESTARFTTLKEYLQRAAILGEDPRGGAMAMLFATELMETRR